MRDKVLLKLAAVNDVYLDVIDEVMELGKSPILEQLRDLIETLNEKAFESNKDNLTIQTISQKFRYILNKEIK